MHRRSFDKTDLKIGKKGEQQFIDMMKKRCTNICHIENVDYKKYNYDVRITFEREDGTKYDRTVEVKSLAGGHPTGVVEVWANDAKTKRPHWFHKDVDMIAFQDRSCNKWFVYWAQPVIRYLKEQEGPFVRCNNNCEDSPGWMHKFVWDEMPGFLREVND